MALRELIAVVCSGCHKVRTEQVKPGVFVCRPCKVIIVVEGTDTSLGDTDTGGSFSS